jgi:serine/threonine protein kinase
LPECLIREYIQQILLAVDYIHTMNIIHRDIKGANILIDSYGVCKLSDFGSAKLIIQNEILYNSFKGTPNWMAPEVVKNAEYTKFSDIWGIGCTVLEMATGKKIANIGNPPWSDHKSHMSIFNTLVNLEETPELPDSLSPICRDFVNKCLR